MGCPQSGAPSQVTGVVKYNDKVVPGGIVTFCTEGGTRYPCIIKPDGTYAGSDFPNGAMVVIVETEALNPDKKKTPQYGGARGGRGGSSSPMQGEGGAQAPTATGEYVKIPSKYADPKKTDLTVNLSKGNNKFDIEMKD
jgi:hypothetical protein